MIELKLGKKCKFLGNALFASKINKEVSKSKENQPPTAK